jgi:hypothetical protein
MPCVSGFISQVGEPRGESFKVFQDLPDLVRRALVYVTKQQDAWVEGGRWPDETTATQFMVNRYDVDQTLSIGELSLRLSRFIDSPVRCQMVRCYVDHGCNMLAAKLAWHEDY